MIEERHPVISLDFDEQRLISSAEVAKILNFSPAHIRRLARAQRLPPAIKIGSRKLGWKISDIEALASGLSIVIK